MSKKLMIGVVLLLLAAAGYWFFQRQPEPLAPPLDVPPPLVQAPAAVPPAAPSAEIRHTIEPLPAEPLPELGASDKLVAGALAEVFGARPFAQFFNVENVVRRIVVTVDNLPRARLPKSLMPVKPPAGAFGVSGQGATLAISPENAARYTVYVRLAEGVDNARLLAVYRRLYPLFQRAYDELGYSGAYFNDRLVAVIDHLLAAAPARAPILLVQPKVFYEFADPEQESLSAGQKLLLRMGNDNAQRVKNKLRELRSGIAKR